MKKILFFILLIIIQLQVFSQYPPWHFINTAGNSHIVGVPDTIPITIDGLQMQPGDYIGAFYYDESGNLKCGTGSGSAPFIGGMVLTGSFNAATIWGSEPDVSDGFQIGEEFKWKVWRASDGSVFDAEVSYNHSIPAIPDSQFFEPNGLSLLSSLISFSIPGIDMSLNTILTPQSGCGQLQEPVSVLLENHDTVFATGFDVSYIFMGDTISHLFTDTLWPHTTVVYTFSQTVDISVPGDYYIQAFVNMPGDVNPTNDAKDKDVIVSSFPVVTIGGDKTICDGRFQMIYTDSLFTAYLWSNGSTDNRIFAYDQGYYSVTVTDASGCHATDSMFLTVNPNPVIDLGPDSSFCEGNSLDIFINGNFANYHWNDNTSLPNLHVTNPGIYSVTVTDQNGCSASDSIHILEIPLPVPAIHDTVYTLLPDTLLNAGPGFSTYLWSDGSTKRTLPVNYWGTYSVTVTDHDCTGYGSVTLVQAASNAIFPNPAIGIVHLVFTNDSIMQVKIYNSVGQIVLSYRISKINRYDIDFSDLSKGLYIIEMMTAHSKVTKKLIKI
ncbi:MAG: T9SS type A sorting domain-containing protein [Bacteroidia bacterium]|nr:T9SS type A sorting domain-containing protein [Bacteroidia bacterium]